MNQKYCIIGAGFTGLSIAYELLKNNPDLQIDIIEKDLELGGLASTFEAGNQKLEKFYHHWLGTDKHVFDLIYELNMGNKLLFKDSRVGIYYANQIYKFSSPLDLLNFKPLPFFSRIRFGLSVIYSWLIKDYEHLENISAEEWLLKIVGNNSYEIIWKPLLIGKFGEDNYKDVAAIWLWNKLIQRGKSRNKNTKEKLAYYKGGFSEFINDIVLKITENNRVKINKNTNVLKIRQHSDCKKVIVNYNKEECTYKKVFFTGHSPELIKLLDNDLYKKYIDELKKIKYLSNFCLILESSESLSETYWLNVNDPSFPFVGIIEHTNFEDKKSYSGNHLIYLSKYLPTSHELYTMSKKELLNYSIPYLKKIFPNFKESSIINSYLWKSDYAQPIITKRYKEIMPKPITPINNFYFCTMSQVYPEDRGTNYAIKHGRDIAKYAIKNT